VINILIAFIILLIYLIRKLEIIISFLSIFFLYFLSVFLYNFFFNKNIRRNISIIPNSMIDLMRSLVFYTLFFISSFLLKEEYFL